MYSTKGINLCTWILYTVHTIFDFSIYGIPIALVLSQVSFMFDLFKRCNVFIVILKNNYLMSNILFSSNNELVEKV